MTTTVEFLRRQDRLQTKMGEASGVTKSPYAMTSDELAEFITWNMTALIKELSEATDEVGWKPWASSRHINVDQAIGEMVDAWHFFLNMMLAMGSWGNLNIDQLAEMFDTGYKAKNDKNLRRQIEGYDGVSDKCPQCHREMSSVLRVHHTPVVIAPDNIIRTCTPSCAQDYRREHNVGTEPEDGYAFREPKGAQVDMTPPFPADPQAPQPHDPEMGEVLRVVKPEGERYPDYATAMNPHALKMVTEAEQTGEPLFCLRARDFFSIQVIASYAELVERYGPDNPDFLANIVDALGEFKEWQKSNTAIVRYPD